jgi:hypothetical protein
MFTKLKKAVQGIYLPRGGFTTSDYDISFLAQALAGPILQYTLSKQYGLPARSTLRKHHQTPHLRVCAHAPTEADVAANFATMLDNDTRPAPIPTADSKLPGCNFLVDDIALEERLVYDRLQCKILGLCRECTGQYDLGDFTEAAIKQVMESLQKDKSNPKSIHCVKEATIVAIATVADSENYSPIPLVITGSCKKETSEDFSSWMEVIQKVYNEHPNGRAKWGPANAFPTDGKSTLRSGRFKLCMVVKLDPQTELGKILYKLPGLNLYTGEDLLIGTCNYKHIFKRFPTLLQNKNGILVGDKVIYPADIQACLESLPGVSRKDAVDLLDPADKQNVPKAVTILQMLSQVDDTSATLDPSQALYHKHVKFIAGTLGYFLQPFIDVKMTLSGQIRSLSTYAHITAAMYIRHKTSFLTSALYADSQAIVKNTAFQVAKLQAIDKNIKYYIILDGTDHLEGLFSNVCTQDHNRGFDILQLSQKLSIASGISAVYARNPHLFRGHKWLMLLDAIGIDHVNPASWIGDVQVGLVDLEAEWNGGIDDANAFLKEWGGEEAIVDLLSHFQDADCNLLQPLGAYVGCGPQNPKSAESSDMDREDLDCSGTLPVDEGHTNTDDNEELEPHINTDELLLGITDDQEVAGSNKHTLLFEGETHSRESFVLKMMTPSFLQKAGIHTLRAQGVHEQH